MVGFSDLLLFFVSPKSFKELVLGDFVSENSLSSTFVAVFVLFLDAFLFIGLISSKR